MGISPSTVEINQNATQSFTQSGIASPVWTLEGVGSLNQSGVYTGSSIGSALIRVHTSFWNYVNTSFFTKNADDTLTKNTATAGYFANAKSTAQLNAVGDFVEFVIPTSNNPHWIGLEEDTLTYRCVIAALAGYNIREYHPSGAQVSSTINYTQNDVARIEIISGGYLQFKKNGTVVYTTINTWLNKNLRFVTSADFANGTVFALPKIQGSNYTEYQATVTVAPDLLLTKDGLEIYCEGRLSNFSNGANISNFPDLSGKGRNLTASSSYPVYNSTDQAIIWDGTKNPLKNSASFQVSCGFMLAKINTSTFANYSGLLSDTNSLGILIGNNGTNKFYDFKTNGDVRFNVFEFRTNDRIYPQTNQIAPMQAYKLLYFRFYTPVTVEGIQIGQDRTDTSRKANCSVKLLALYSRNFSEQELRAMMQKIATQYSLTLADVFPFEADIDISSQGNTEAYIYDPPEGDRVAEVLGGKKQILKLNFTSFHQTEAQIIKDFEDAHYPEVPFFFRDKRWTPPRDIEGYFNSEVDTNGSGGNMDLSFEFKQK